MCHTGVILVDYGIATGSTIRAAIQALRQQTPKQIIIAFPTSSAEARAMLEPMVDDFITLISPEDFRVVGQWYHDFTQTTDDEVTRLLALYFRDGRSDHEPPSASLL